MVCRVTLVRAWKVLIKLSASAFPGTAGYKKMFFGIQWDTRHKILGYTGKHGKILWDTQTTQFFFLGYTLTESLVRMHGGISSIPNQGWSQAA